MVDGRSRSLRTSAFLIGERGIEGATTRFGCLPGAEICTRRLARGARFQQPGKACRRWWRAASSSARRSATRPSFPILRARQFYSGAGLLVNLSNDSWFAAGAGPELHFQHGILRAVETRRSMVRVSNGGITALVLPDGRVVARDGGAGSLLVSAPILEDASLYVRFGDWFAWVCLTAAAATALSSYLARRGSRHPL